MGVINIVIMLYFALLLKDVKNELKTAKLNAYEGAIDRAALLTQSKDKNIVKMRIKNSRTFWQSGRDYGGCIYSDNQP